MLYVKLQVVYTFDFFTFAYTSHQNGNMSNEDGWKNRDMRNEISLNISEWTVFTFKDVHLMENTENALCKFS